MKNLKDTVLIVITVIAVGFLVFLGLVNALDKSTDNQNTMLCASAKVSGNREYQELCAPYYENGNIEYMRTAK